MDLLEKIILIKTSEDFGIFWVLSWLLWLLTDSPWTCLFCHLVDCVNTQPHVLRDRIIVGCHWKRHWVPIKWVAASLLNCFFYHFDFKTSVLVKSFRIYLVFDEALKNHNYFIHIRYPVKAMLWVPFVNHSLLQFIFKFLGLFLS